MAEEAAGELGVVVHLVDYEQRHLVPDETVRRVIHAVLDHQADVLHDDATVLLARWAPAVPVPPIDTR